MEAVGNIPASSSQLLVTRYFPHGLKSTSEYVFEGEPGVLDAGVHHHEGCWKYSCKFRSIISHRIVTTRP
jgi:hypothetical protein